MLSFCYIVNAIILGNLGIEGILMRCWRAALGSEKFPTVPAPSPLKHQGNQNKILPP
jgi:hypothetical protein